VPLPEGGGDNLHKLEVNKDGQDGRSEPVTTSSSDLDHCVLPSAFPNTNMPRPPDPSPQSVFKATAIATFNLTDMKNLIPLDDAVDELPAEPSLAMPLTVLPVRSSQMDKYIQLVTDNKLKEAAMSLNPTSPRGALKESEHDVDNEEASESTSSSEPTREVEPVALALPKPLSSALPKKTALDPMKSVLKGAKNQTNEVLIRARFALNKRDGNVEEVTFAGDLVDEVRRRVDKLKALSEKWQKTLTLFKSHSAQVQRFTQAQQLFSETFRGVSRSDSENQSTLSSFSPSSPLPFLAIIFFENFSSFLVAQFSNNFRLFSCVRIIATACVFLLCSIYSSCLWSG